MQLGPRKHQAQLALWKVAVDDLNLVESDLRAAVGVPGVKVRVAVVVKVHRDRDPEESADRGHEPDLGARSGRDWQAIAVADAQFRRKRSARLENGQKRKWRVWRAMRDGRLRHRVYAGRSRSADQTSSSATWRTGWTRYSPASAATTFRLRSVPSWPALG